jgi:lipopolysaccharide exporter
MLLTTTIRRTIFSAMTLAQGSNLMAKSVRAVMKLGVGTIMGHGMRFVRRMILARLLAPSDIGTVAIVFSISIMLEALTEVGVKQSVIQNKKGASDEYLNMAWWMQLVRGLCLFCIAAFAAPWIGSFYGKTDLVPLLRVAFLAIVFRAFVSPRAYVLEKEYKFGRRVVLIEGSVILGSITTIVFAFLMRNVWALVLGFVSEAVILFLFSFILAPFVPKLRLDRESLVDLLKYARGIFGLPILTAISFQAPILILGKLIADYELGLFEYAYMLAYFPTDLYMRMVAPIFLPAFSIKQDEKQALCRGIIQVTRWTSLTSVPLIAFMMCCGSELLYIAYKPQYAAMAIPFAVLCMQIIARNGSLILAGVYMAVGKPHLHRFYSGLRALAVTLIYPAVMYGGVLGGAFAIIFGNFVVLFLQVGGCRKIIGLKLGDYISSYTFGLVSSIPIIIVFDVLWYFKIDNHILVFGIGAFALLVTLGVSALIVNHQRTVSLQNGTSR